MPHVRFGHDGSFPTALIQKIFYILVGDGRETSNLKSLAQKEGLIDQVVFAGNRSQAWIAGAFNLVDINVAPLCGRSLLEASLGGLPAVSYDVDWHSEIVVSGSTGFLVPNLDYSENLQVGLFIS